MCTQEQTREAALAGLGPTLLPDWLVARDLARSDLIDCFPRWRATATDFATGAWLIYPSREFLPNKVRVTMDFVRAKLGHNGLDTGGLRPGSA